MAVPARAAAIVAVMGLVPALAFAQGAGPQPPPPPPADTSAPTGTGSAKPVVPATGYGWSTTPAKRGRGRARLLPMGAKTAKGEPTGTVVPGFETLADGSSRVFVQLPRQVAYAPKPAKGSITYVLKGVHIDRRNNLNALVTVHFNTPVSSARLVPHGNDLWFVVDLRANVQPTVAMDATKDGGAMLRIEFPKGDYLNAAPSLLPVAPAAPAASGSPAAAAPAASSATPAPASSGFAPSGH